MARIRILTTADSNIVQTAAAIVAGIDSFSGNATEITILGNNGDSIVFEGTGFQFNQGIPVGGEVTRITLKDGQSNIAVVDQFSVEIGSFDFSDGLEGILDLVPDINFFGNAGDDVGFGATGNDTVRGAGGNDTLTGFGGNDLLSGNNGDDLLIGLGGKDTLLGSTGDDRLRGGNGADVLTGGAGNDTLDGGRGKDLLSGGTGIDTADYSLAGATGAKVSLLIAGYQKVNAAAGNDKLVAIDNLIGSVGGDDFTGRSSANVFEGRGGDDTLTGGLGADSLHGGLGNDNFDYNTVAEAKNDKIFDFGVGDDVIDLSGIDANRQIAGNQQFDFIGTDSFNNVRGELRFSQSGGVTSIQGDINGDGTADFTLQLVNGHIPTESDFIL